MRDNLARGLFGLLEAVSLYGCLCRAGEPARFPTRIVVTPGECAEIRANRTLRGRRLRVWTPDEGGVLEGSFQALTGRKSDIINWFRSGQEGLERIVGGDKNGVSIGNIQYDLLCSEYIKSGDLDVIREVIWHARDYSGYLAADWRTLSNDQRLTLAERMQAWYRSFGDQFGGRDYVKEFWSLFGKDVDHDAILDIMSHDTRLLWSVFPLPHDPPSIEAAKTALTPLLRREYLSVRGGKLAEWAIGYMKDLQKSTDMSFPNMLLDRLTEWDALSDERSVVVWHGVSAGNLDEKTSNRLRSLMGTAKVPENAAKAFWAFCRSPVGRRLVGDDSKGWPSLFREYLDAANGGGQQGKFDAVLFLAGRYETEYGRRQFKLFGDFRLILSLVQEGRMELGLGGNQRTLLAAAWSHVPEALNLLKSWPAPAPTPKQR